MVPTYPVVRRMVGRRVLACGLLLGYLSGWVVAIGNWGVVAIANLLRSYWRIMVAAPVIAAAIYFVFISGPVWSCCA